MCESKSGIDFAKMSLRIFAPLQPDRRELETEAKQKKLHLRVELLDYIFNVSGSSGVSSSAPFFSNALLMHSPSR